MSLCIIQTMHRLLHYVQVRGKRTGLDHSSPRAAVQRAFFLEEIHYWSPHRRCLSQAWTVRAILTHWWFSKFVFNCTHLLFWQGEGGTEHATTWMLKSEVSLQALFLHLWMYQGLNSGFRAQERVFFSTELSCQIHAVSDNEEGRGLRKDPN